MLESTAMQWHAVCLVRTKATFTLPMATDLQTVFSPLRFCSLFTIVMCLPHFVVGLSFDALFLLLSTFRFKCNCENVVLFTFVMAKMVFRFHSFITRSECAPMQRVYLFKSVCSARNGTNNRTPNEMFPFYVLCPLSLKTGRLEQDFWFVRHLMSRWNPEKVFIYYWITVNIHPNAHFLYDSEDWRC